MGQHNSRVTSDEEARAPKLCKNTRHVPKETEAKTESLDSLQKDKFKLDVELDKEKAANVHHEVGQSNRSHRIHESGQIHVLQSMLGIHPGNLNTFTLSLWVNLNQSWESHTSWKVVITHMA